MRARSAIGLLCGLAAIAVLVGLLGGSRSPGATLDPVAQAANTTTRAGGAELSLSGSVSVPGATSMISFTGEGHVNFAAEEGELTLAMSGFPAVAQATQGGGSLSMTELFKSGSLYIGSPLLSGRLSAGVRWVRLDLGTVGQAMGLDASSLTSVGSNPAQYLAYLKDGGRGASIVGHESVRGVATTHYAGELNLLKAAEAQPGAHRARDRAALQKLAAQIGGSGVPVEVWVDAHDLVRRVSLALTVASNGRQAETRIRAEYFNFGPTPGVSAPSPSESLDVTQQALRGLAAG